MLVGEAPGADEDASGVPFVGKAGKILDRALNEAGLVRSQVYITNTAKCRPPGNRTPTQTETDTCLPYLVDEIATVRPRVVVALGNAALNTLTGKKKITQERGKLHLPRKGLYIDAEATAITATIHPSACQYEERSAYYSQIVEDLRYARSIVEGRSSGHKTYIAMPGTPDEEVARRVRYLMKAKRLTCDLEWTAGRDSTPTKMDMIWPWSRRGEVYSISLTGRMDDGTLVSLPVAWPVGAATRAALRDLLATRPTIFHNAMADILWLRAQGFSIVLAGDSMLLAHLVDESQMLKLEAVASKYSSEVQAGWKGVVAYERPPTEAAWRELLEYNAEDTRATMLAFEGLVEAVKAQPPERRDKIISLHRNLLIPALPVLMNAAYVGVPIDVPKLEDELQQSEQRHREAGERLAEQIGMTPVQAINLANSPQQTKQYLSHFGVDIEATDKNTLSDIVDAFPQVQTILDVKKEQKLLSTYFRPWLGMLKRQGDGRLHTIYRMTGTRTGRLSAEVEKGGSIHVAPRDAKDGVQFRRIVRAQDGRKILAGDYSTIEMKIAAYIAHDPVLLEIFSHRDSDVHKATAAFIKAQSGTPIGLAEFMQVRQQYEAQVTKGERQGAKGVNFGLVFGMQEAKLVDYARFTYGVKMTLEQARAARDSYFQLYAGLGPWHERARNGAFQTGYTESPFGRRRRFDPSDVNAAINTPVQSTASDLTMLAMVGVAKAFLRERLDATIIGFIHDSVLVDVSDAHAERANALLLYEMENVDTTPFGFKMPFPLVAETKIGQTWGEAA